MKKQIAIAALTFGAIVLGTDNVQAQDADKNSATTEATISLGDVLSLTATSNSVDFNYASATDYNSDQTKLKATTLTVTSNKNFDINVKAEDTHFTNTSSDDKIPVNVLKITVANSGSMVGTVQGPVILSTTDQPLILKGTKGSAKTLDLDFTIPKEKSSTVILGMPTGKYTQTIMYTVTNSN